MFQEWGIESGVVCYDSTASDGWLKTLLKTLVDRGGGVNNSGCRGVSVGTKPNIRLRVWGGRVSIERPNGDVDKKNRDQKVHEDNQSLIGDFGRVRLQ